MFFITSYYLKFEKTSEYQKWLLSQEAKGLIAAVEKETGAHYRGTYWTVLGLGEYDCEDWWELANWNAMESLRDSPANTRFIERFLELGFADPTRSAVSRVLRTTEDIRIPKITMKEGT